MRLFATSADATRSVTMSTTSDSDYLGLHQILSEHLIHLLPFVLFQAPHFFTVRQPHHVLHSYFNAAANSLEVCVVSIEWFKALFWSVSYYDSSLLPVSWTFP